MKNLLVHNEIEKRIFLIRGQKVMLDFDLAVLYGVSTKRLNEQVKRNFERFPEDFMFQLTENEFKNIDKGLNLKSQIATSSWGGKRKLPYVFTEQGVSMLSSVLRSKTAIQVNIAIMRTFVRLKQIIALNKELSLKLEQLEIKIWQHDEEIKTIFLVIKQLMQLEEKPKKKIGFLS